MLGWSSRDVPATELEISPVRCFVTVVAAILITQTVVMVVIHLCLPTLPLKVETIVDDFLLAFALFPILYIFVLNPLLHTITELKLTEERLRASEQKFKILFQSAPVAIFVLDTSGIVTQWNAAAERIFGWKEEEVVGKPYPIACGEECAARFKKLMSGESLGGVHVQRSRKDGSKVDVSRCMMWLRLS